ncbi:hypothetical protein [Sulfurovum sp.]|jgi:hypothetical protein|uniref:hypothetical protein n=1 Tax=Sulfurovum sp. TaxID=1969726 RepID=UPI002A362DF7|nr:hypothetical protein [Sulfurovum sp.]MDY0403964.1 hypothetical protein [Sulfurovum sp.]
MKTFGKVLLGTLTVFLLTGCFENDKEYYLKHPDETEKKLEECYVELAKAGAGIFGFGNKEAVEKIMNDPECKAADEARKEIKRAKYEMERKKQEEEEKQKKIAWEKEYQEQLKYLDSIPYADFDKIGDKCGFSSGSPQCKAYKQLEKSRYDKELEKIITQHNRDIEALDVYKNKMCKKYSYSECQIIYDAINKLEKEKIDALVNNENQLKEVYNSCYHEMTDLRKKQKWQEASKVTNSRKCMIAGKAAQKFGIYTWTSPIK